MTGGKLRAAGTGPESLAVRPPAPRPSFPRWPAGIALALLAACGGGGGGEAPAVPPVVSMGVVSATLPTHAVVTIENPWNRDATATAGASTGPFSLGAGAVPVTVPGRGSVDLDVVFIPAGPGDAAGTVVVHLEDARGDVHDVPVAASATAEPVVLTVTTPVLAFGEVLSGDARIVDLLVRNDSALSPAPLSIVAFPAGGWTLLGPALPRTVAPGATETFPVRYQPSGVGDFGGTMTLGADYDPSGPLSAVLAATTGGRVVTDYGTQTLDTNRRTPVLTVDVPADAISLSLEGEMGTGDAVGLAELTGPGGKVYENTSSTGAFIWIPGDEVGSPTVPNTDRSDVQLVPGGGTYSFRLFRWSGTGATMKVRAIVERRPGPNATIGVLDLDVWLANAITPKAATASTDVYLQQVLDAMDTILSQAGVRLGDVRYHDVTDAKYDDVTDSEFPPMLRLTASVADPRLNLFFVRTALGGGVLGVSATIAGPLRNGTGLSGIMSLYGGGYSASLLGLVAAHEIGHYLGLYHTAESDGSHDFVDDTAECPASGTSAACPTAGGGYLMHWQAVGGTTISPGQAHVIVGHPCVGPDVPPVATLRALTVSRKALLDAALFGASAPEDWCATCARCRSKQPR